MKNFFLLILVLCVLHIASADTRRPGQITPIAFNEVTLTGGFWQQRMQTELDVTVPFSVGQCGPAVERFRRCAAFMRGEKTDLPEPHRFISSDLYKVMEGAAYSLMGRPDPDLEAFMDSTTELIAASQQQDGYLYITHTCHNPLPKAMGDKPYSWLTYSHELYNVGHLYEAAAAYFQATGKRALLDVAIRNARHVNRVFFEGDPAYNDGKPVMQAPGHEEIELALCKLYRVTGDRLFLEMAKKFLDIRGVTNQPDGEGVLSPTYAQQHAPVAEQTEPIGHAVRAVYLYTAMAQVDALTGRNDYEHALNAIWNNLVSTRMHITGGLGAIAGMEGFGPEYELPNRTAYNETCAAVGNVFFNQGMFLSSGDAKYLDVAEISLFNNALAGINLAGDRFFYVNPLEADGDHGFNHGSGGRAPWFGCACCPPNISRMILQVPGYMYAYAKDRIYLTLYGSSKTTVPVNGREVEIEQTSEYPFDGSVRIVLTPEKQSAFRICFRIPTWCSQSEFMPGSLYKYDNSLIESPELRVNGKSVRYEIEDGFAVVKRTWEAGDIVEMELPMPVRRVVCNPKVKENIGTSAIIRGPLVYCAEEADNGVVQELFISNGQPVTEVISSGILKGIPQIRIPGYKLPKEKGPVPTDIALIPYYAWCNRHDDQSMKVWLPADAETLRHAARSKEGFAAHISGIAASSTTEGTNPGTVCDGHTAKSSAEAGVMKWVSHRADHSPRLEIAFDRPMDIETLSIFWVTGRSVGLPAAWTVSVRSGNQWKPLDLYITDTYRTEPDRFNVVHPATPLKCDAVRIEMTPQEDLSVGISEIRFD